MAGIQVNRTGAPSNLLPPEVSSEIWADAQEQSVVMQRARRVELPGNGLAIPVITGDPQAQFVAETDEKKVSRGTLSSKLMTPYKIAVIEPFSMEFARDLPALYNALRGRLGGAIARVFDAAVLSGPAPGSGFDTLASAPSVSIASDTYQQFVTALGTVVSAGGDVSAWVLAPQGEVKLLSVTDGDNRPLFVPNPQTDGSIGAVLGRPVYKAKAVYKAAGGEGEDEVLGIGGDWASAVWGSVSGISFSVSTEATLTDGSTQINLWQRNMFAVRAEIEVGFVCRDVNRFVKLTGQAGA